MECYFLPINSSQLGMDLVGFSYVGKCRDKQDRINNSYYLFKFYNAPILRCSKKQSVIALSTCESEYITISLATYQAIWLASILKEFDIKLRKHMILLLDIKSTTDLARNLMLHGRSKHFGSIFHFLREQVNKKVLMKVQCLIEKQLPESFNKIIFKRLTKNINGTSK